jgi:hypothetical protein
MDLLLGHNQFLGISHISEERSRERDKKFSDVKNIYKVVEKAVDLGYKGMILETHPRMLEFLKYYKNNETFQIDFYLQLPYIQGYIQKMNEQGLSGLILEIVRRGGIKTLSSTVLKNLINYVKKDYITMAISFLQFERAPFRDINIKAILLHNVVTDLLLSLRISSALEDYNIFVEEKMEIKPGFITLNFELFKKSFEDWNIKPHLVMTPINPGGYDMNPSSSAVETALRNYAGEVIAMNILGGGAFSPSVSCSYLKSFKNIEYCVIGASSNEHLKELIKLFKE